MCKQANFRWLIVVCIVFANIQISKPAVVHAEENDDAGPIIDLSAPVVASVGELKFRECRVSSQGLDRKVQCAWHTVSENPQAAEGKTIDLFVVRLPAKRHLKHINDPMLFIAGGPGQAASESFLYADHMWPALASNRDFYLIDQRGTGHSNYMGCDDLLAHNLYGESSYNAEKLQELVKECLAELPGNPELYTTDISIQDFEKIRAALGIKEWNLLGVSYGTRMATHYIRRFPQSLRSVVLDSVVPPQHVLGSEIAMRSQNVLDELFQRCEADSACKERMGELEKDVETLFTNLKQAPIEIRVENFATGAIEDMIFTREHLVTLVRLYLYSPNTFAVLPPMLHEAARNANYSPLARAARGIIENLQGSLSVGLHNSVMCSEEYPWFDRITEEEHAAGRQSYMGDDLLTVLKDICSVWPTGDLVAGMKEPLISSVPTLLFSGELDPITPPDYAEQTMKQLEQATHLVLPGQGHFVSHLGCAPDLVEKFITDKSAQWLNTKCLQRLSAAPLFLNFNGTAP